MLYAAVVAFVETVQESVVVLYSAQWHQGGRDAEATHREKSSRCKPIEADHARGSQDCHHQSRADEAVQTTPPLRETGECCSPASSQYVEAGAHAHLNRFQLISDH